jgi:hypothetical protein
MSWVEQKPIGPKHESIMTREEYEAAARWADSTKKNGEKPALSYAEYLASAEQTYEYCVERQALTNRYRGGTGGMSKDEFIRLHDELDRRYGREETYSEQQARYDPETKSYRY